MFQVRTRATKEKYGGKVVRNLLVIELSGRYSAQVNKGSPNDVIE